MTDSEHPPLPELPCGNGTPTTPFVTFQGKFSQLFRRHKCQTSACSPAHSSVSHHPQHKRMDVCRQLSDLGSSLISQSRKHYLLHIFAASKHNQPFLGISSKINSLILLPSTWKENFPSASSSESMKAQRISAGGFKVLPTFPPCSSSARRPSFKHRLTSGVSPPSHLPEDHLSPTIVFHCKGGRSCCVLQHSPEMFRALCAKSRATE